MVGCNLHQLGHHNPGEGACHQTKPVSSALGCILCKLLHDRLVGLTPSYCEVLLHLLTRDVCKALDCIVELHTHSVTPISVRLVLASQLQQTGVLWHLAHAVGIQTKRFSSEIAQRASTISCAERTCQGDSGHSRDEGAGNIAPCSRSFQKMIKHMLQLTVTVGGFWPGMPTVSWLKVLSTVVS